MAPNKSANKGAGGGGPQRLKVVVRKLPADLPADVFWRTTSPWIAREGQQHANGDASTAETVVWSQYRQGKVRRAYVPSFPPRHMFTVHLTRNTI